MKLIKEKKISYAESNFIMDIIHDFFLDVWPKVKQGYNPEIGPLTPFAYRSFYFYAINAYKLIHKKKLKKADIDSAFNSKEFEKPYIDSALKLSPDDLPQVRNGIPDHDYLKFQKSLADLTPEDRELLQKFHDPKRPSIRKISDSEGISRHKSTKLIEHAHARLLMAIERPAAIDKQDWKITRLILTNHYTIKQAANHLDIPTHSARDAYKRTMDAIANLLQLKNQ